MGTSQSSQQNIDQSEQEMEKSLYEILGVEPDATDAELKKAYKKQALLLHPDRNFDRVEEATTKFAKVQAAYDILSDPQERAWYDSHGSEGRPGSNEPEYGGKITKQEELERYLDPALYVNVASQPDDFYSLIDTLFQQLAQEEHEAALDAAGGSENTNDLNLPHFPAFGNAKSNWSVEVKPFYDSWSSFSSIKSFVWENIYRSWDAPDRRSRRAMEIRNKKIQDAARNEFNVTVRNLVKLIKQKDPRVKAHNKKNRNKADDANSKEQAKRDRKRHTAKKQEEYEEQEWEKVGPDDILANINDDSEDDVVDVFECVVCDKIFKNKKQLSAHELSKKHIKNLKDLQREMRREGVELGFDEDNDSLNESENDLEEKIVENTTSVESDSPTPPEVRNGGNSKPNVQSRFAALDLSDNDDGDQDVEPTPEKSRNDEGKDEGKDDRINEGTQGDPTLEDLLAQLEDSRGSSRSSTPKPTSGKPAKGKAKQRRQKKNQIESEFANKCSVCQTVFPSRNKLFEHVKLSGHASAPR
ncbi:Jjj1p [Sugiyamaella lignohabitans]|uniref:Jjj1p n=1 Tax=Sugiyamaella lignohabitans TaxID=796027 RepID=A0A167D6H2_9ASCO|nr:Jjj1p [Sugiyamaella lignohabitans]ANB12541.1 Jjj1p [Sugiyamaella lignohabitans]